MVDIITFLAGGSVLAFLIIQYLKRYIQNVIGPKYGDLGVQTFLLLVSMALATFLANKCNSESSLSSKSKI